jgi:phosphoribosyl 1,2-cyclic phosphodiesterase
MPTPGSGTARHGGNTSCVEVMVTEPGPGDRIVLDAGTGIAALGREIEVPPDGTGRIDVLLSHLHLDHIQGLGFFAPLFRPGAEVHLWGPSSTTLDLRRRLSRYLSPPLFPVALRDLPCRLGVHDVPLGVPFRVPGATVLADLVCHPGPTVGYRITDDATGGVLAYLSDHEPALGDDAFPTSPAEWTSGARVAAGADLLVHDVQFTVEEYAARVGWGHSSLPAAVTFADLVGARRLVAFHHDPSHDDAFLDRFLGGARLANGEPVVAAVEGASLEVAPARVSLPG